MKILDQYLIKQTLAGIIISTIVLMPLFSFLDFVEELDDVGKGFYELDDAFFYVLLNTPRQFIQLSPFIALLGNVIALGRLAVSLELVSIRAAGYSPVKISKASVKAGLLLITLIIILEQFVAPPLQQKAIALRSAELEQGAELGENLGIWARDERQIMRIGNLQHNTGLATIEILRLDDIGYLSEYILAEGFEIIDNNKWILRNVTKKQFKDNSVKSSKIDSMSWVPFLNADQISTLTKTQESLSPVELYKYIKYLNDTGQDSRAYSLILWRKLGGVITTMGMLLFSIPFVFGSARTGFANRLVIAGIMGIVIYMLDQIISNAGLLFGLNLFLVAIIPGVILIILSRYWLGRIN